MIKKIIVLSFIFLTNFSFAQNKEDLIFSRSLNDETVISIYNVKKNKNTSYGFFLFYKKFISSQDSGDCNFYPSCSVYGTQSFQKLGFLKGLFNTFDRLTRCNGLNRKDYHIHKPSNLLYDPVF
jgi:putative component of membrane protein insertase Oxa1/YidC/SpoIIIJ protein YidD